MVHVAVNKYDFEKNQHFRVGETGARPGLVVTGVGCYRGVLCKTITLMAKSPTADVSESTKVTTDERKPSMHGNYSRYGQKSLFIPLKLFYAYSQLFF